MNNFKIKFTSILSISLILVQFIISNTINIKFATIVENSDSVNNTESVYDIILFWGQSNMVGTCRTREENRYNPSDSTSVKTYSKLSGIDEDLLKNNGKNRNSIHIEQQNGTIFEYMYTENKLEEVNSSRTGFGENLAFSKSTNTLVPASVSDRVLSASSGINMIPEFCREYYKNTGHKVVIVFAALGGRPIRQFLPYDDEENTVPETDKQKMLYEAIKEKYIKAIDYLEQNNFNIGSKLYVVFQGESNVGTTKESYKHLYLKVHNNLKNDLKIQKGVIVETAREAGTFTMNGTNGVLNFNGVHYNPDDLLAVNGVHYAQEELIEENNDIILGSSFAYDSYVPLEFDYDNCNTKVTLDTNGNKLPFSDALEKARSIEDYMESASLNNGIHYTSAALSQIGRESARNLSYVIDHTSPTLSVNYSTTLKTNQNVSVTISTNEQIKEIDGWTLSSDKKSLSKTYLLNTSENITIFDLAGNSTNIPINITNIDKTNPENITNSEKLVVYDIAGNSIGVDINITDLNNENIITDNLDKPTMLPNTGIKSIIIILIIILLLCSIILYFKNRNLDL